jgi:hypothetical protein
MTDLTLRIGTEADFLALQSLAERDSAVVPGGTLLVAESSGRLLAAISLETRGVIADPFQRTSDAVELLRRRAMQLRRAHGPAGPKPARPLPHRASGSPAAAEA